MAYSQGPIVHDADAHLIETPTWLRDHADPAIGGRIPPRRYPGGNELRQTGDSEEQLRDLCGAFERLRAEDRGRVLNLLGSSSQLAFSTFHDRRLTSSAPRPAPPRE